MGLGAPRLPFRTPLGSAQLGSEPLFPICVAVDPSRRKRTFGHRQRGGGWCSLKTAKTLGLTVLQSIFARADDVIELSDQEPTGLLFAPHIAAPRG